MRGSRRALAFGAAACAAITVAPAIAAAAEPALEQAAACGRRVPDAERLRCYDALFRSQAEPSTGPADEVQEFGLTEPERRQRQREAGLPSAPEAITSRILRITARKPHPPELELENGQRWRLLESSDFTIFRVNDTILIRRAALGSYLASAEGRSGAWRVRRME